ncbi:MAG: hypothetical protein DME97_00925 [Verrucomicrobia bacterium]|nr:MAG: hypothetical protein DME97_00925 [Verrucomicrobiota bacterium]
MSFHLSGPFILNEDVLIIPVADLPEESRTQIEFHPGDFAVSRLQARSGSKIIDPDAAALLGRFRDQRTVVEAVILFAREKQLDPNNVLEGAYPFLRNMIDGGFLIPSSSADEEGKLVPEQIVPGARVLDASVLRTLHVLEDTEVYLLGKGDRSASVLKIERRSRRVGTSATVRGRLEHEAEFLSRLKGALAPRLLGKGELDGRLYLEMEFIPGVDVVTAATEWRERGGEQAQDALLCLAQNVARTYAALHERGILHGDVHPSNVLIKRDGTPVLIDFGVAGATTSATSFPKPPDRGGIPFFFEPEMAAAALAGLNSIPASEAGEQHAVASLIYLLLTGAHWQNFRLGREAMLEDIATLPPLSFRERGVSSWPALETVLVRALSKVPADRFRSMAAFASALSGVSPPSVPILPARREPLAQLLERALTRAAPDGEWSQAALTPAPATSLNYGSAGVALGLLQIASRRNDGSLLALADIWSRRAIREMGREDAFYNEEIEITPELVGKSSPYHSPSGVHAVAALVAVAAADPLVQMESLAHFLKAVDQPTNGLDLTLGRASILLGAAILLDALPRDGLIDLSPLRSRGDALRRELWQALDAEPEIARAGIAYPGIAHGWAGFLYATLQWCSISETELPPNLERRLGELAALALPADRGLDWPWMFGQSGEPVTMPGWCNGACGYVFLWTLAHRLLGDSCYLDLAYGAAWRSWDAPDRVITLCCGLAGRAYALLNLYRHTDETIWVDRARALAVRGAIASPNSKEYPHSLYKGEFGLAVLAADLEQPDEAAMPFFEPLGYRHQGRKA